MHDSTHDPTPILCRNCGAPIAAESDVTLRCEHCDTTDELPSDAHARVRELRRRLAARARQVQQLTGLALGLALAFEDPRRCIRVLASMGTGLAFLLAIDLANGLADASLTQIPCVLADTLVGLVPFLGVPLALLCAFYVGRRLYLRDLRGLLQARAPGTRAGRARCRCCGADLPDSRDPLICCRHCHTHSLVTPELHAQQSAALAAEGRTDHQRHQLASRRTARIGHTMDLVCYAAFVLGYFASLLLMYLLVAAVTAIF